MFNETSYSSGLGNLGGTPECEAIKANCDRRFPPNDEDLNAPETELWYQCMKATGYYDKGKGCFESVSYDQPGATMYPVDVLTNPDNPDYLLPNLGLGGLNTPALLAIAALIAAFFFLRH